MQSEKFKIWFDGVAKAAGYEKLNDCWLQKSQEITRAVNLQKSEYSNSYYVNFGFIINSVPLGSLLMHIGYRLTSTEPDERVKIDELLDLDSALSDSNRESELQVRLLRDVFGQLQKTISEADLLSVLMKQPHLNNVPLSVKKHFGLHE